MKKFYEVNVADVLSILIAVAALVMAMQAREDSLEANRIAEEGNRIAQDASSLAQEANQISRESNVYASKAITLANDSNYIAEEANAIAVEANQIMYTSSQGEIVAYMGPGPNVRSPMLVTAICEHGDTYGLVSDIVFWITLANRGIKPSRMVDMRLEDDAVWAWDTKGFVGAEEQKLPLSLEPGYTATWKIVALALEPRNKLEEAYEELGCVDISA